MYLQNTDSAFDIGSRYDDMPVEPTGSEQCRIQYIGAVGRSDQNNPVVGFESIHLDQQLVQGLFALIIAPTEAGATVTSNRVNFVDKYNARRFLLALNEQIANPRCADTDEHFDEVGTADAEERHSGFAGDRPR